MLHFYSIPKSLCLKASALAILLLWAAPVRSSDSLDILFIGSSYTNYNHMPGLFHELALQAGKPVRVTERTHNGWALAEHVKSEKTREIIQSGHWDAVVLQSGALSVAYPFMLTGDPVYEALDDLKKLIHAQSPRARLVYCLPWAWEGGFAFQTGPKDDYTRMQDRITHTTLAYAEQLNLQVAPVGIAWYKVLSSLNWPEHYLHDPDLHHPNLRGSYLKACVLYCTLFCEGLSGHPYSGGLEQETAHALQEAATTTVMEEVDRWRMDAALRMPAESHPGLSGWFGPIAPHPFRKQCSVQLQLPSAGPWNFTVNDLKGRQVYREMIEAKHPGTYRLRLTGAHWPAGPLLFSLRKDGPKQTRLVIHLK